MVSFTRSLRVAPDVLSRQVGDELVLLDLKTERYLGLDAVGARMWSTLIGAESIEAAFTALAQEYDVAPAQLRDDLSELVATLIGEGLVELVPQDPVKGAS